MTGPKSGGAPLLFVLGTNEGRYEQFLINTLGPIELWALSTSAEDVILRTKLYEHLGAGRARQMLALIYPGGSARAEIKRRVMMKTQEEEEGSGGTHMIRTSAVIDEILQELVDRSEKLKEQESDSLLLKAASA